MAGVAERVDQVEQVGVVDFAAVRLVALGHAGDLEVTDAAGRFRFSDVPAGRWLLIAWRDVPHAVAGQKISKRDLGAFVGNTEIRGHAAVEYWRLAVDVRPGATTELRLHDRNVWLTVIQEDTFTPPSRAETVEGGVGSKRRQDTTR